MERGYFALWRKFQDHRFWQEKRVFSKAEAWIDILWEAQHKKEPQEVLLGMKILICNYGETLKSISTWAKRWDWGRPKVDRFLKLLKNMRQIDTISETVTTRIIVLNYKEYDIRNSNSDTQACRKRAGSVQEACTDKNVKNVKNIKNNGIPYEKIKLSFNELLPELPKIKLMTIERKAMLKSRWNTSEKTQTLKWWKDFFSHVQNSPFLMGKTNKPFKCNFDWIIKKSNFIKIIEGNYHRK